MATAAVEYAQSDLPTVQKGLDSFGRTAANVQEYRDAYVSFTYIYIRIQIHYIFLASFR